MIRRLVTTATMRAPRTTEETSRFFASTPQRVSRRVTRASAKLASDPATPSDLALGTDIEDAITRPSTKRRRITKDEDVPLKLKDEGVPTKLESPAPTTPKPRRKPARKTTDSTGATITEPPTSWLETYNAVLKMRQPGGVASNAAVDTMGCERLADRSASPRDRRFQTLVALMLSSQTKDTVNAVAMEKLKMELPAWKAGEPVGLNLENMLAVEEGVLNGFIRTVGFHNNKTKYVRPSLVLFSKRIILQTTEC